MIPFPGPGLVGDWGEDWGGGSIVAWGSVFSEAAIYVKRTPQPPAPDGRGGFVARGQCPWEGIAVGWGNWGADGVSFAVSCILYQV